MRKPEVTTVVATESKQTKQVILHASKKDFLLRRIVVQCLDVHRQVIDLCEAAYKENDLWTFDFPGNAMVKTFRFELVDDTGQVRHIEKTSP